MVAWLHFKALHFKSWCTIPFKKYLAKKSGLNKSWTKFWRNKITKLQFDYVSTKQNHINFVFLFPKTYFLIQKPIRYWHLLVWYWGHNLVSLKEGKPHRPLPQMYTYVNLITNLINNHNRFIAVLLIFT